MELNISEVYNTIADDFSKTRYKVWESVGNFIDTFEQNSVNADIGCGNGKNILYRPELNFKGMDISSSFVDICKNRKLDVIEGNILNIPFKPDYFDNVICIAVIHHLKTQQERVDAIRQLLKITKKGGKIMIYVWAFEQPQDAKRKFSTQDEMVYFKKRNGETYYRYYHLYKANELEHEIKIANNNIDNIDNIGNIGNIDIYKSVYEKGNWYCIFEKK